MTDGLLAVPERYRSGLERFARWHVEPGGLLLQLLADGPVSEVLGRMDRDVSLEELRALLSFIHNELMPGTSHGSAAAVAAWIAADPAKCLHCRFPGPWYETQPAAAAKEPA